VVAQEETEENQLNADGLIGKIAKYREEGKYEEAIDLCNEILEMESEDALKYHVEALVQMGGILNQLGRYEDALEHLQTAVNMAPRHPRIHYELGMFYKQYGDRTGNGSWYNKAIIEFEKTRMIDPDFENVSAELAALKRKR
jgi:tetratricopeptide (TPR) repeat protein